VRAARAKVRSVQGEARVAIDAPGRTGTVSQFLAAERPDRLHVETLDFFGNVAAVLVAGGGRFSLYDARERVLYRGAATPANLARLVPLPLPAEDLVDVLCGSAPLPGAPVAAEPGPGTVRLELEGPEGAATLHVGEGAVVERAGLRPAGRPAWTVRGEVYRFREGTRFPTDVTLEAKSLDVKLALHWREVEVNGALDPGLFALAPPQGARVVDLDAEPAPGSAPPPASPIPP
jgi:hypothetical protein